MSLSANGDCKTSRNKGNVQQQRPGELGISVQVLFGHLSCHSAFNNLVWLWVGNRLENHTVYV